MDVSTRQGLVTTPILCKADRSELVRLADLCNQHEGLKLPLTLREPAHQFFYYEAGVLVGYMEITDQLGAEVCGMVHPDHRRKGVGSTLPAAAQERCRLSDKRDFLMICDGAGDSGKAFASSIAARYRHSEYQMKLDMAERLRLSRGPLRIRRATLHDVDDFVRIVMAAFQHDVAEAAGQKEMVTRWISDPNRKLYLAELEGKPIGTISVYLIPNESRAFLNALGVLPQHQHRGHGRQILTETVDTLVAERWEHIMLEVQTDNRRALSLYQDCGFKETVTYEYYQVDVP